MGTLPQGCTTSALLTFRAGSIKTLMYSYTLTLIFKFLLIYPEENNTSQNDYHSMPRQKANKYF